MKVRKLLAVLLAAAMAVSLLCIPALAAPDPALLESLNSAITLDIAREDIPGLEGELNIRPQFWNSKWEGGVATRTLGEPKPQQTVPVYRLPLGVTLAAGPQNPWTKDVMVLSDPDGDGIFVQRLEKECFDEAKKPLDSEVVPVDQTGTLSGSETVLYYGLFDWNRGHNLFKSSVMEWYHAGYRTLTTDYLVKLFGVNTLLMVENGDTEEYVYFLLTGEKRPADMDPAPLSDGDIFISAEGGFLVSQWALEVVDKASSLGLLPSTLEAAHNYNLQEQITRGEFAALCVYLYCAMADLDKYEYPEVSPFVDVKTSDPNYKLILSAHHMGFVKGTSTANKTFEPDALVSRQDAAVMLARVYEKLGGTIPAASATAFADNGDIAGYARSAVAFMNSRAIINGVGGNRFNPKGNASVEQALKIALEMLNKLAVSS